MDNYKLESIEWSAAKEIVDSLFLNNTFLSPYSSYRFLNYIINKPNIRQKRQYKKCSLKVFALCKNGKHIYLAPLFVNCEEKKIYLAGHFSSVGHIDFIYKKDVTEEDFQSLLSLLKLEYEGFSLVLNRISQFSKTYNFLIKKGYEYSDKEVCVKIDFSDYDKWFSSLSKSCRQNIRTAYNRINREQIKYKVLTYINETPLKKYYNDHISLFAKRILEHSKLTKVLYIPMKIFKKREALSKALLDYDKKIFAGIYFENKLVGTLNGVIANDGRAIITRLSINVKYGVYCPGGLLINETIKAICAQNQESITSLDLSRGDEKYKYTYGGCEHYNYSFTIRI